MSIVGEKGRSDCSSFESSGPLSVLLGSVLHEGIKTIDDRDGMHTMSSGQCSLA